MKTTREVFVIMRAGKIDKGDHEIVKKTILSICKQYVIWLPITLFYVGNAFKINKKQL